MNTVAQVDVNYLRPNRTIETVLLTDEINNDKQKVVYVYNYEGYNYKIFEDIFEVIKFFNNEDYTVIKEYSTDKGVDRFLQKFDFSY